MAADAPVLALELLYDAVVARFAAEGPYLADGITPVMQPFGWRFPAQHHTGARIVWIPGDPIGAIGTVTAARNPGTEPRSLGTLLERFHVIISSQDPTDPEDERLQYRTTRLLRDAWFRAVYLAAHGTFLIESEDWLVDKKERRFGTALVVTATIEAMIPDVPPDGETGTGDAPADTGAEIDVTELDVTETLIVAPLAEHEGNPT